MIAFDIDSAFNSPFSTGGKTIPDIVSWGLNVSIAIAGVILLIIIILSGYKIISGAGKGSPDDLNKGVKTLTMSFIGFLIVIFAYLILRLVEYVFFKGATPFTNPSF